MKKISFVTSFLLLTAAIFAGEMPSGYYDAANGKSGDELRSALMSIIDNHTVIGYSSLPTQCYAASSEPSDFNNGSSNLLEDIYSSKQYTSSNAGSSASDCGEKWNKEHTVPQSWFEKESPMVSDAFHIYPTDIKTNSTRSNFPYGETDASLECSDYGYGALGTSNRSGYSGKVFEPRETATTNYKGDIARGYFYMLTRYMDINFTRDAAGNGKIMFTYTNSVADFTDYALDLMMEWHREDPVSEKERIRNNAIYAHQKNRNPFIDYPCLAEYIWGTKKGETVDFSKIVSSYDDNFSETENSCGCEIISTDPRITVSSKSVAFGATEIDKESTQTITVNGSNLTDDISLALSGTNAGMFNLSTYTVSAGEEVTITYTPTAEGAHTATLTLTSADATSVEVTLTGSGAKTYTVTFNAGAGSCNTSSLTEGNVGEGITLPTATAPSTCSDYTFAGWATTQVSTTTTRPTLYTASTTYNPTSNCTLYAVYQIGGNNTKVTELSNGDIVVIYYPTSQMALTATASDTALSGVATTVEGNSITSLGSGAAKLTVETDGNNFRLKNGEKYLICPETGNGASFSTEIGYADWTFEESDGIKYIKNVNAAYNNNPVYLEYYNKVFKAYTAKTLNSIYQFEFYKYETTTYTSALDCANCTATNASFANSIVEKLTTDAAFTNTFSSDNTADVGYTSSNTDVATIDANGEVTIWGMGTTTITATQADDGTHCSVAKDYKLTVTQPAIGDLQVTSTSSNSFCIEWNNIGNTTYTVDIMSDNAGSKDTVFFENALTFDQGDFTINNVSMDDAITYVWKYNSKYSCMVASAYMNKTSYAADSWLISPAIDLSKATSATLTFEHAAKFQNGNVQEEFQLMVAKNPSETLDATEWKQLTIPAMPTAGTWDFVSSDEIDLSDYVGEENVRIAFRYVSTSTAADTWRVKNVKVSGKKYIPGSISGYPQELTNETSHCATELEANTNYKCVVTTAEGNNTDAIEITTTITPVTTYNITISNPTMGGKATANPTTAAQGDMVTLIATPDAGYTHTSWSAVDNTMSAITVANNQFTMPASDVVVSPQFALIDYTISANLTNVSASDDNATTTQLGKALGLNFKANQGYTLPANITVKVGETTLESSQYTWNQTNGQFTIGLSEMLLGNIEITIAAEPQMFTIIFKNEDGTELQKSSVAYGETPVYNGTELAKASTAQYDYEFSGWSPEITPVTGEATYTAQFTQKVRSYTVTFVDYDGKTLDTQSVEYGATPTYSGATPTKAATAQYEYTFSDWSPEIAAVTGETTYTAQFTENVRTYYVWFADYDGETLDEQYVEYGSSAIAPADPQRTGYTFTGWDADFSNITGELMITAQYEAIAYSISSNLSNATTATSNPTTATIEDSELSLTFTAAEGYELPDAIMVTMGGTTLVNETDYLWDKTQGDLEIIQNNGIQGNIVITIAATTKSYGVLLDKNEHGAENGLAYIYYLGNIDENNCMWVEPSDEKYVLNGYFTEANGGTKVIDANGKLLAGVAGYTDSEGLWQHIGSDITLYAQWSVKTYTVKFVDYDGTTLSEQPVEHGSSTIAPADPQRTGYTFTGWDTDFSNVTSDLTITAVYKENKPTAVAAATLAEPICHTTNSMLYVSNLQTGSHLALYDAAGRLIAQRRHCNETEHFILPNGIYIIKIEANGQTLQIKAVK